MTAENINLNEKQFQIVFESSRVKRPNLKKKSARFNIMPAFVPMFPYAKHLLALSFEIYNLRHNLTVRIDLHVHVFKRWAFPRKSLESAQQAQNRLTAVT